MSDPSAEDNAAIAAASAALAASLSPLGRRLKFPPDIPFQAAEARGKELDGTIGQITDGRGGVVPLPAIAEPFDGFEATDRARAILYSPVPGVAELRSRWRAWQRREVADHLPSTLPLVVDGLTHGLSIAADLFGGEGRKVAVPAPFWGNYRQTFTTRTGAEVLTAPAYRDGRYNPRAIAEVASTLAAGEPLVAILNLPSNPGGYSATLDERAELRRSLVEVAAERPLVVLCDDAYAGLVYEDDIPRGSMFWELNGGHPNLVPIKIDGATKELGFFGGRVGFLTFPFAADSAVASVLESKVKCLVRATVGSPVAASQVIVERALRRDDIETEVEVIRSLLAERYRALRDALDEVDPDLLDVLPFNSGCFALVEVREEHGLDAERVRRHLLDVESTGLIAIAPRYLRIAFCSVSSEALPELVRRLERGVRELARGR